MNLRKMKIMTVMVLVLMIILANTVVFAAGDWGKNTKDWVLEQVWYIALAIVGVVSVKFIAKKMWVQLGGFLVLSAIVLVVISGPEKLKDIGEIIWLKVFG